MYSIVTRFLSTFDISCLRLQFYSLATVNRRIETALGVKTFKHNDVFLLIFLTICEFLWFLGKFVGTFPIAILNHFQ